ncbi:hypothetical protein SS50377_24290 [Spironucleus salmonicida]|uniref:Transmembrane protein n=1 Tax=Spironucleus salmonicida TaxID=348837 RepID=V6LJQ7_9EUKA|nr:hypothetical protein SS50377_24290 [Spironucleus salmonicida]|eukprot:EST44830.1 Hypothetical protein SS50377_15276 [Spironucleus salmonicida]
MIILLAFSCQIGSSSVLVVKQTDSIQFQTQPSPILDADETISCRAQTGKTAVYEIQIGTNTFRSEFVVYDAFQDNVVELHPVAGSSAESASTFVIASYMITFLDNNLDQTAAVGQLIVVIYNYNQCIYDPTIQYESFTSISAVVKTNPKCIVTTTSDVMYILSLEKDIIIQRNITQASFDFGELNVETADCLSGTEEYKKVCSDTSLKISGENFINLKLIIIIPKSITSINQYTNDYGVEIDEEITLNFNLIYNIDISQRDTTQSCTSSDKIAFFNDVIYIYQIPMDPMCDISIYSEKSYWITASELADESGKHFQLQFYTSYPFELQGYISCSTWEISDYDSMQECQQQQALVQTYPSNMSQAIIYKLSNNTVFTGSYRFTPQHTPTGNANITITHKQMCVQLNKNIYSTHNFVSIQVNVSETFHLFNKDIIQVSLTDNFEYPSKDNTYCYPIEDSFTVLLSKFGFSTYFGVVSIEEAMFELVGLEVLVGYDSFWQGWVFIIAGIIINIVYLICSITFMKRKSKTSKRLFE